MVDVHFQIFPAHLSCAASLHVALPLSTAQSWVPVQACFISLSSHHSWRGREVGRLEQERLLDAGWFLQVCIHGALRQHRHRQSTPPYVATLTVPPRHCPALPAHWASGAGSFRSQLALPSLLMVQIAGPPQLTYVPSESQYSCQWHSVKGGQGAAAVRSCGWCRNCRRQYLPASRDPQSRGPCQPCWCPAAVGRCPGAHTFAEPQPASPQ